MSPSSSYTLRPATPLDIPHLPSLYLQSFTSPLVRRLKPNTPAIHAHLLKKFTQELSLPDQFFWVVTCSDNGGGEDEKEEIVAFAKWTFCPSPEEIGGEDGDGEGQKDSRGNELTTEGDADLAKKVVELVTRKQEEILGEREYWYLHILCTHPSHRRQGLGSLSMTQFCSQIDSNTTPDAIGNGIGYLEASPDGKKLYEKFGFVTRDTFSVEIDGVESVDCCMLREGVKGGMR